MPSDWQPYRPLGEEWDPPYCECHDEPWQRHHQVTCQQCRATHGPIYCVEIGDMMAREGPLPNYRPGHWGRQGSLISQCLPCWTLEHAG